MPSCDTCRHCPPHERLIQIGQHNMYYSNQCSNAVTGLLRYLRDVVRNHPTETLGTLLVIRGLKSECSRFRNEHGDSCPGWSSVESMAAAVAQAILMRGLRHPGLDEYGQPNPRCRDSDVQCPSW